MTGRRAAVYSAHHSINPGLTYEKLTFPHEFPIFGLNTTPRIDLIDVAARCTPAQGVAYGSGGGFELYSAYPIRSIAILANLVRTK